MIVRKLGVPGHEELAMGAVASGGVCLLNEDVLRLGGPSQQTIEQVIAREQHELRRQERLYRGGNSTFPKRPMRECATCLLGFTLTSTDAALIEKSRRAHSQALVV
jgi:predicted phosphoribosyltransferase